MNDEQIPSRRGHVLRCRWCTWYPADGVTLGVVLAHCEVEHPIELAAAGGNPALDLVRKPRWTER